ncbi:MAG: helix-turn-helix transcriptional regulator [Firmicutes bacterium]|nr:helix-turn-helix transcriptional regulator [Bacillota bacterium]
MILILAAMRMEKAREFLLKNNENILEIANNVGYSNSSHFATAFRDKYGVNPSVYRENMRNLKSVL